MRKWKHIGAYNELTATEPVMPRNDQSKSKIADRERGWFCNAAAVVFLVCSPGPEVPGGMAVRIIGTVACCALAIFFFWRNRG